MTARSDDEGALDGSPTGRNPGPRAVPVRTLLSAVLALAATLQPIAASAASRHARHAPNAADAPSAARPDEVAALVDSRMKLLRQYALEPARAVGGSYPSYNRWLGAVASAIRSGSDGPGMSDANAVAGDAELDATRRPYPQTKDLQLLAAIKQQSHLTTLGPVLTTTFKQEPSSVRAAAADRLLAAYRL